MKVIFLQKTTDVQGGSKVSLRNTLEALSDQPDIELEVLGAAAGPLLEFSRALSIPVQIVPFPRWRNVIDRLQFNRKIKKIAKRIEGADWVISNEMWWAPHAVALAEFSKARSAAIVRDEVADLKKSRQYKFHKLDQIISVSEDLKSQLKDDYQIFKRTRVIYNIIEPPRSDPHLVTHLDMLCSQCPKVKRWILSAGTICPRKDQILAVKALAELVRRRNRCDVGLLFVGGSDNTDYVDRLKSEVRASELEDRVVFTGHVPSIAPALKCAGVFLLTSHSEGLPRVLIEAGLAEVPSLSTQVSGVNEVYGTNAKDHVASTRDPIELAGKLECILDSSDYDGLKSRASKMAERYSKTSHLRAWRAFLADT